MTMEIRPFGQAMGAEVVGVDVSGELDSGTFQAIESAIAEHAVVVVRDQALQPAEQARFARRFGTPQVNVRADVNHGGVPEVFWVSNVTRDGKPLGSHDAGRYWHSDLCYLERPSSLTILYAVEVPEKDGVVYGDTAFAGAHLAFDALPEKRKRELQGLRAANSYRTMWKRKAQDFGAREVLSDEELAARFPPDAYHPIIREHPVTGRKCLYVCDGYTTHIEGMSEEASAALLAELFEHLAQPSFRYVHQWRVGDVLIWDNCSVQHKATFDFQLPLRRVMQRCTIEGSVPY